MDHPFPWLKYLDASDLDDEVVDLDGMNVESPTGEHLGTIDGFIVDSGTRRPYYVVVDSGGWFKSKDFLLPVGHGSLDLDREALVADLDRTRIDRFPGFSRREFEALSKDELNHYGTEISNACAVDTYASSTPVYESPWERPDYRQPDWWRAKPVSRDADPSPHFDGRAQPGDVIGVETGGERTYLGETGEDENLRRRDAEQRAAEQRKS